MLQEYHIIMVVHSFYTLFCLSCFNFPLNYNLIFITAYNVFRSNPDTHFLLCNSFPLQQCFPLQILSVLPHPISIPTEFIQCFLCMCGYSTIYRSTCSHSQPTIMNKTYSPSPAVKEVICILFLKFGLNEPSLFWKKFS